MPALGQPVGDPEDLLPRDVPGGRVDRDQPAPRRPVARQRGAADLHREAGRALSALAVRYGVLRGRRLDVAEGAEILGDDEEIAGRRVHRHPAPVGAADPAGEREGGAQGDAGGAVDPRGERAGVVDLPEAVDEVAARGGVLGRGVLAGHEVVGVPGELGQAGRLQGYRLGGRGRLAGDVAGRHRALLDPVDGLAGIAVEDVEIAGLGGHPEGGDRPAGAGDVEEGGRGRRVGVPQVVVDGLEVPPVLAGGDVHRDEGVAVEVVAGPVAAVVAGNGGRQRQVHVPALRVHREVERPRVGPEPALPAVAAPGVVPGLAGLRDRAELPHRGAGARVEGARVADAADGPGGGVGADHHHIAVHEGHRVVGDDHVDGAALAEALDRFPGRRVERAQVQPGREDDARVRAVPAGPPGHAAARRARPVEGVPPDLAAGRRVEGDDAVGGGQVHDPADDDRGDLRVRPASPLVHRRERVGPRLGQTGDVGGGDSVQGGEPRPGGVAPVHGPVAGVGRGRRLLPAPLGGHPDPAGARERPDGARDAENDRRPHGALHDGNLLVGSSSPRRRRMSANPT